MTTPPLYILLSSADRDKIQIAAMLASVGAVSDRAVHVFVSMGAIKVFAKATPDAERYGDSPFKKELEEKNAPDPITLFGQGKMLGEMSMYACSMVMDVLGWEESDLVDDLFDGLLGLTKFLSDAEEGQLINL